MRCPRLAQERSSCARTSLRLSLLRCNNDELTTIHRQIICAKKEDASRGPLQRTSAIALVLAAAAATNRKLQVDRWLLSVCLRHAMDDWHLHARTHMRNSSEGFVRESPAESLRLLATSRRQQPAAKPFPAVRVCASESANMRVNV